MKTKSITDTQEYTSTEVKPVKEDFIKESQTKPRTMMKNGSKGGKIKVEIPTKDNLIKKKGNHYPKGYWSVEQRVARYANNLLRSNKVGNEDEAFHLANKLLREKFVKDQQSSKKLQRSRIKPPLYNSKENWKARRIVGLLEDHNNGVYNRVQASKIADKAWEERIAKQKEKRLIQRTEMPPKTKHEG